MNSQQIEKEKAVPKACFYVCKAKTGNTREPKLSLA